MFKVRSVFQSNHVCRRFSTHPLQATWSNKLVSLKENHHLALQSLKNDPDSNMVKLRDKWEGEIALHCQAMFYLKRLHDNVYKEPWVPIFEYMRIKCI